MAPRQWGEECPIPFTALQCNVSFSFFLFTRSSIEIYSYAYKETRAWLPLARSCLYSTWSSTRNRRWSPGRSIHPCMPRGGPGSTAPRACCARLPGSGEAVQFDAHRHKWGGTEREAKRRQHSDEHVQYGVHGSDAHDEHTSSAGRQETGAWDMPGEETLGGRKATRQKPRQTLW